jgi:hypothetical protein
VFFAEGAIIQQTMIVRIARVILLASALLSTLAAQTEKQPMAEQVFTNVQVLKGIPVSEFMSTMGFFAASVGLNCVFCHVPESLQDWKKFAEDVPRKRMARSMIAMVNTINKNNFGGRAVITCYSCHHGNERPKPIPSLALQYGTPEEDPNEAEIPPQPVAGPSAVQLLDKFIAAMNGSTANGSTAIHTSFGIRGTYEGYETYHQQVPFELWAKAPAQIATVVHTQNASPNNPVMLLPMAAGAESDGARLDAQLFFPAEIRQAVGQWRAGFPQTSVGDKDVDIIEGSAPDRTRVKLFFDQQSGLLVRQLRYVNTIVGTNPYQIDYSDYRDVNGIKLPYQWVVTWTNGQSTWRVTDVQADAAIPTGRFARPAPAVLAPARSSAR